MGNLTGLIDPDPDRRLALVDDSKYFLETLTELRQRTKATSSEYDLVKASGLLRVLLVDKFALKMSEETGVPLVFRVNERPRMERPAKGILMDIAWLELDPRHDPDPIQRSALSLPEFMEYPLMRLFDEDFSVQNVIRVAANGFGGSHRGNLTRSHDKRLAKNTEGSSVEDALNDQVPIVISHVRQISISTREACEPARQILAKRVV